MSVPDVEIGRQWQQWHVMDKEKSQQTKVLDFIAPKTYSRAQLKKYKMFQLKTDFNLLLMNITFSELIMSVFGVPVDFTASLQFGWKLGEEFCQITGFVLTLLGMYSINIFTAISLYRLIFIQENVSRLNLIRSRPSVIFPSRARPCWVTRGGWWWWWWWSAWFGASPCPSLHCWAGATTRRSRTAWGDNKNILNLFVLFTRLIKIA